MTPRAFQRLFPNASRSTFAANFGERAEPEAYAPTLPVAESEPDQGKALDRGLPGEKAGQGRALLRITRYALCELDRDNLFGGAKPLIDCIKEAGLILDDSPKYIDLVVEQALVKNAAEERTEIEIVWL